MEAELSPKPQLSLRSRYVFGYTFGMEVVGAIIRNASGEYLLQQRDENAPSFKHCWTLFGGLVEQGEEPEVAFLRELNEELDLDPKDIHSIKLIQTNKSEVTQYIFEVTTSVLLDELTLHEGESMAYIPEGSLFDRELPSI